MFCLVPFLLAFSIQILMSIPCMGISFAYTIHALPDGSDMNALMRALTDAWSGSTFTVATSAIYGCAALVVFCIWYHKRFAHTDSKTIANSFTPLIIVGIIVTAVGLQYVTNYLANFVAYIRPDWAATYEQLMESIDISNASIILACYSVIIAPICEELIFRGVTLSYAKREMPFWIANVLQASLFGLYHMNWIQGIYAFFIGLFLGFVAHKGGSLWLSIFLHACFNLWGTFAPSGFMYKSDTTLFFVIWLVFGLVCLYLGLFAYTSGVAKRDAIYKSEVNYSAPSSDI